MTNTTRTAAKASDLALKWAQQETRSAEERVAYATAHRALNVDDVIDAGIIVESDRLERAAQVREDYIEDGAHTIAALLGCTIARGERMVREAIARAVGDVERYAAVTAGS